MQIIYYGPLRHAGCFFGFRLTDKGKQGHSFKGRKDALFKLYSRIQYSKAVIGVSQSMHFGCQIMVGNIIGIDNSHIINSIFQNNVFSVCIAEQKMEVGSFHR